MDLPRVTPVGVAEFPPGFRISSRVHPRSARALAAVITSIFLAVATTTTVLSLGGYCITSQAGEPAPIPSKLDTR